MCIRDSIYSCRKIEKHLLRDIHYIWLAGNEHPDFITINRFRNRVKEEINNVFTQLVLVLADKGFISLDVEYIDGTKIESKANKYTFVWRKTCLLYTSITKYGFSSALDDSIFSKSMDDEIILCLNYDGLYGINNMNKFLQSNNPNPSVRIGVQTYKVGDPVLFNESNRFAPLIYNNLKGKILAIEEKEDCVYFTIEIYLVVNELDVLGLDLVLLDSVAENTSVICFKVELQNDGDEDDDDLGSIVPFQIAYAVSIHKAQGLEYDSVKVVITNEIEEMVSHNIFYTAITRAKEKLKIYWSPETEKRVLENMKVQFNDKDYRLFKEKFKSELNLT